MSKYSFSGGAGIALLSLSALSPVQAVGLDSETVRDAPGIVIAGNNGVKLTVSGQVNRGVLFFDDGEDTGAIHVDNDNSSTRVRFLGEFPGTDTLRFGTNIELQFESNSTASVDQDNQRNVGPNGFTERKLEAYADIAGFGRLTIGQGDTASNNTSEVDLSGTSVIAYSGVADLAGGLRFRDASGALTESSIGSAFSNLDGLSRDDRLRYDSRSFAGVSAAVSAIADERWDAALRYKGEVAGFTTGAALSYADTRGELDSRVNGSLSILHGSGLSLTVAAGEDDRADRDPRFGYLKAGLTGAWNTLGATAVSVDVYEGEDIATRGADSSSVGFQVVQNIERYSTEVYAGLRNYELDNTADDILASLVGLRVKF